MKKILFIMSVALSFGLLSCDKDEDPGTTPLMEMSNEWWVHLLVEDGNGGYEDIYQIGYFQFLTSGTAANTSDSLFVDDFGAVAELKAKVAANPADLTFGNDGTAVQERYTEGSVVINNGKILLGQGLSTTGVKVDSIFFEVEFDWDPGQKYIIAGHGRTGFLEDEH
jgi:hypothetical protein